MADDVSLKINLTDNVEARLNKIQGQFSRFSSQLKTQLAKAGGIGDLVPANLLNINKTESSFANLGKTIARSAVEFDRLKASFLSGDLKVSISQFEQLEAQNRKNVEFLRRLSSEQRKLIFDSSRLGKTINFLKNSFKKLAVPIAGVVAAYKTLKKAAQTTGSALAKTAQILRTSFAIGSAVGGGIGAFVAATTAQFDTFRLQLQALNSDALKTAKEFAEIRKFAAASPLSTEEVVESFVRLRAVGVAEAQKTTATLGNVAAVFNRDLRDVTSAFVSLESRTLRRLGIVLSRTTSNAIVKSGDLIKVVNNDVESIRKAVLEIFGKKTENAFKVLQNSIGAQFKVFKSLVQEVANDVGEVSLAGPILKLLQTVNDFLKDNQALFRSLVDAAVNDTDRFVDTFKRAFEGLIKDITEGSKFESSLSKIGQSFETIFTISISRVSKLIVGSLLAATDAVFRGIQLATVELAANVKLASRLVANDIAGGDASVQLELIKQRIQEIRSESKTTTSARLREIKSESKGLTDQQALRRLELLRLKEINNLELKRDSIVRGLSDSLADNFLTIDKQRALIAQTLTKELASVAKFSFEGSLDDAKKVINSLKSIGVEGGKVFSEGFVTRFSEAFRGLAQSRQISNAIRQLNVLVSEGVETTANIDIDLLKGAKPLAQKRIAEINKTLLKLGETSGLEVLEERFNNTSKIIDDLNLRLSGDLIPQENIKSTIKFVAQLETQLKRVREQIDFRQNTDAPGLFKELKELENFIKKFDSNNVEGGVNDKLKEIVSKRTKVFELLRKDLFSTRSLGTKILDELFSNDTEFQDKISKIAANSGRFESIITQASGLKEALGILVREDKESRDKIIQALIKRQIKNIQLPTAELKKFNQETGKLDELFQGLALDFAKTEEQALLLIKTLRVDGGGSSFAKRFNRDAQVLGEFNKVLLDTKLRFLSFGKDLDALNESAGGKVLDSFSKFLFDSSKVLNKGAGPIDFTTFIGIDNIDQAKLFSKLKDVKTTIQEFFQSEEFASAIKPELIAQRVRDAKIPEAFKQQFQKLLELTNPELVLNNIENITKGFLQGLNPLFLDTTANLEKLRAKAGLTGASIAQVINSLPNATKAAFEEQAKALTNASSDGQRFGARLVDSALLNVRRLVELSAETLKGLDNTGAEGVSIAVKKVISEADTGRAIELLATLSKNTKAGLKDIIDFGSDTQAIAAEIAIKTGADVETAVKRARDVVKDLTPAINDIKKAISVSKETTANTAKEVATATREAASGSVELTNKTKDLNTSLSGVIQSTVSLKDTFKAFRSSVLKDLGAVILKALLFQGILGRTGQTTQTAQGSSNNSLFDFKAANGGVRQGRELKAFAGGGIAKRPTIGLFGEKGAEAFVPLPDKKRIPVALDMKNAGAGNNTIALTVNAVDSQSFVSLFANNSQEVSALILNAVEQNPSLRAALARQANNQR